MCSFDNEADRRIHRWIIRRAYDGKVEGEKL